MIKSALNVIFWASKWHTFECLLEAVLLLGKNPTRDNFKSQGYSRETRAKFSGQSLKREQQWQQLSWQTRQKATTSTVYEYEFAIDTTSTVKVSRQLSPTTSAMNTLKVITLISIFYFLANADVQDEISHLVQDIVTGLTRSDSGVHDVAFVDLHCSVLEKAFREISESYQVTVQHIGDRSNPVVMKFIKKHTRFISLTFEILSFLLMEAYLAKVIAFLSSMQYEPNYRTLADLDRIKQPFVVNSFEKSLLTKYPNLQVLDDPKYKIKLMDTHSTVSFCKVIEYWHQSKQNYNPKTNDRRVYILNERLMSVQLFYTFATYSPFTARFQECIDRLASGGIWDKVFNRWSISQEEFETFLGPEDQMIKYKDLTSLWAVATIGYLVGICVFIVEIMKIPLKFRAIDKIKHFRKRIRILE
ncbi:conserved hypothetical protein [Culex quinquefasciatus]|uniref:Uncharacterized protein n=1 Tax=Culex quinquefasciatus TaxID=7176 RepID=B0X6U6_CULQU|nr:conserved hypothetical protein [Culex quinquefasciatus]|eukprot:XP_001865368.1 conserved hypothetical protein [Culex quinquefasciatus]